MASAREKTYYSRARVEAYTDGVFAIAATLLVLDLTTRSFGRIGSDAALWDALAGLVPNIIAFVVSFILLSMLWVLHLDQFRQFERVDSVLIWINNIRLLFIVLIPFTTTLVSEYSQYYAGRILMPVNFFLAALSGYLTWAWAASRGGHLLTPDARTRERIENIGGIGAVISGAVAVALSPWLGSWAFLAYAIGSPLTAWWQTRARGAAARSRT